MANKSKNSAAVVFVCTIAAVLFFGIMLIVGISMLTDDTDPYKNLTADPYMTITQMDVNVDWDTDRSCKVTQKFNVLFHTDEHGKFETTHGFFVDIPVNSGEKVRGLTVTNDRQRGYKLERESGFSIVRVRVGDEDKLFSAKDTINCAVSYTYITPEHRNGPDVIALMAVGRGWMCPIERANVKMTFPAAPEIRDGEDGGYGVYVAGKKASGNWSDDGKTLTVSASLDAYSGIEIACKLPDGTMHDRIDGEFLLTLVIGLVLFIAAALLRILVAKNKPLTPIVDFYPPRVTAKDGSDMHMLPVQMGKIIDDRCSSEDVTSLIFYWASKGFLEIEQDGGETYLIKLKPVKAVTAYEERLFGKLFEKAKPDKDGRRRKAVSSLSGKFANEINSCKLAVNNEYKGKFYKSTFTYLSIGLSVVCGLFGVGIAIFTSLRVGLFMLNLLGILAIVPAVLSGVMGMFIAKYYFKLEKKKRSLLISGYVVLTVLTAFAVSLAVPTDVMSWLERVIFFLTLGGASAIAPFLVVRTDYYNDKLNSILGFRDFLRDAEKERLEMLLADDPQYYYDILPYANVLGVSDIWEEKFKGLTIEPPTYYRSTAGDRLFSLFVLHDLSNSMSKSLTYVPPSAKAGSFSSYSGGGHGGGGGFSGGSFGGGGGGRW